MLRYTLPNEPLPINSLSVVGIVMKVVGLMVARRRRTMESVLAKSACSLSGLENFYNADSNETYSDCIEYLLPPDAR